MLANVAFPGLKIEYREQGKSCSLILKL
ncbi:hypothetical protein [Shewanella denitrificans]